MRTQYRDDIAGFNKTYGAGFGSFGGLLNARDWRPQVDAANRAEIRDNREFLLKIVEQYYSVAVGAIRKFDRNHMIVGDSSTATRIRRTRSCGWWRSTWI
jgi:hypothetical protein